MTTLKDIRVALADMVETLIPCTPYSTDAVVPPCAMIERRQMTPDLVFGETTQIAALAIRLYFQRTEEVSGQMDLDELFDRDGSRSIKAVIENGDNWATSLGVDYCKLISWGEPQTIADKSGAEYLTARIDLEVCW